jgi:hypothetical protein
VKEFTADSEVSFGDVVLREDRIIQGPDGGELKPGRGGWPVRAVLVSLSLSLSLSALSAGRLVGAPSFVVLLDSRARAYFLRLLDVGAPVCLAIATDRALLQSGHRLRWRGLREENSKGNVR